MSQACKPSSLLILRGVDERFAQWYQELADISANPVVAQQRIQGVLLAIRRAVVASFVHPETKMRVNSPPATEVKRRTQMALDIVFAKREEAWSSIRITDEIEALLLEKLDGKATPIRRRGVWCREPEPLLSQG